MSTGVARTLTYMEDVRSGKIPACEEVRQAIERQFVDLERENTDETFPYWFDETTANRVVDFIEMLPHVKGREFVGKNIELEGWECFIVCVVFGWLDIDELRRYRAAYIEVPRKNAKSTLSACVGLYMQLADNEPGAEVYSAATGKDQAKIVFDAAKKMVDKKTNLQEAFGVSTYGGAMQSGSIVEHDTGSIFKPLARDQGGNLDGLNIHCGIIDELHAHKTRDIYDVIDTGTGARQQPLVWAITTAGFNRAGICYEQRMYVKKLLSGVEKDDTYFGIIYTIDKDDDWKTREAWQKANPNWGISVNSDDIQRKAVKAIATASAQNNFLTKHLNVWVNAATVWMNMAKFEQQARKISWDEFKNQPCWISLDLASRIDIAAANYTWKMGGEYFTKNRFWLPSDTIEEEKNAQYPGWAIDGFINATPGAKTDFRSIEDQVREDMKNYQVQSIAYDPYQSQYLANNLSGLGANMVEFAQTVGNMSEPMKEWEGLVMAGKYFWDSNPVFEWMVSNVMARFDAKDNIFPIKEEIDNKIDGAVAQIMSLGMCMGVEEPDGVYFL